MLRKFFTSASLLACTIVSHSQDSTISRPVLTYSVDAYYRSNFHNPKASTGTLNNFTSFTNSNNSFELGMASIKAEHSFGKIGAVADLGFGRRAEEFSYNDANTMFAIKQAYLTYTPWKNVKLTGGSFATHIGYELVDAYLNRNYSMSYMFSKGPFFHTGVKADFTMGKTGFMVGVANPTDLKTASFRRKMYIAQYSVVPGDGKFKAYLNYQGGKTGDSAKLSQFDLVLISTISSKFNIGFNGTIQSSKAKLNSSKYSDAQSWSGAAVYLNLDPKPWLGFTLRSEYFDDNKQLTDVFSGVTAGGNIFANTLSANFKIDNLTIIPEVRMETSSKDIYAKNNGTATKSTASVLLAAVYKFN